MDIACPKCNATYRLELEITDQPKALKCAACAHVFGVKRAGSAEPAPAAAPKRVTGEINPELKKMAEEEAKRRADMRQKAEAAPAQAEPAVRPTEAAPEEAAAPKAAPKPPDDTTPAPTPQPQTAEPGHDDARPKRVAEALRAEKASKPQPATATDEPEEEDDGLEAFEAVLGDVPERQEGGHAASAQDQAQGDGASAPSHKKRRMGLFGTVVCAALVLLGIAASVDRFAPELASAWPGLEAPLALFQSDYAAAWQWVGAQWDTLTAAFAD